MTRGWADEGGSEGVVRVGRCELTTTVSRENKVVEIEVRFLSGIANLACFSREVFSRALSPNLEV
jgi:hypothetical protein